MVVGTLPRRHLHVCRMGGRQSVVGIWRVFGSQQRTIRALMDVIRSREIAHGVAPAPLEGESRNAQSKSLAHDVSILPGVGYLSIGDRPLGSCPRAAGWSAATLCPDPLRQVNWATARPLVRAV